MDALLVLLTSNFKYIFFSVYVNLFASIIAEERI